MRRVLKWQMLDAEVTPVPWSVGDRVLHVGAEWAGPPLQAPRNLPTLWLEQTCHDGDHHDAGDPENRWGARQFTCVATGTKPPAMWEHVGSAVCGPYVWHVYGQLVTAPPGQRRA